MGGIAKGIGNVIGSITGANQAAEAQKDAANQSNATNLQIYREQQARLQPWLNAGQTGLAGLQGIAGKPINRNALLANYFNSPEYQQLSDQARYQGLNAAEATGGLGSTATGNMLSSISDLSLYPDTFHQSPDSVDSALLPAVPQIQMDLAITIDASRFQPELFNLSCQSQVCPMAL